LLLDIGDSPKLNKTHLFKFELSWMLRDGFYEMVAEIWQKETKGSTSLEKIAKQNKILEKIPKRLGKAHKWYLQIKKNRRLQPK
jgi:hypothetical protein